MIWQLIVGVVFLYCLVLRWRARHLIKFSKLYKNSIKALPVLGHSYCFIDCKSDSDRWNVLERFSREALKQGGVTTSWNLHRLYCIVADPVIAECIMKNCLEKDDSMKLSLALVGNGSAVADVPIWRPRRKVMVPTFSHKNLLNFEDIFSRQSMIMIEQLKKVADYGSLSLSKYIMAYAMDSVCETALGISANSQQNPNERVLEAFIGSCKLLSERITKPWLHFNPIYKLTSDYTQFMGYVDTVLGFIGDVIQTKREEIAENNKLKIQDGDEDRFKTFLELMIESSGGDKGFNNTELREETVVLFTAGTDTSTLGSSFTCVLLARHPHIQEKVYQELKEVFGDTDRAVTAEDLPRLKYLEAVIKETLRLYPPAPNLLRKVDKDVILPSGDTLPEGTGIFLSLFATHRNPKYWGDDAEQFRPERFIDAPLKHPAAFLAFSYGPRNCIGYRYAMMSMKTVLATLLLRYRVLSVSKLDIGQPISLKFDIMLRASDDFQVILESRS
ncbi:cytochrome P450 4d8-like [Trichoplusia ni]|uniref:Cytochrome P450 4d8-like n=1 Tax=Trichoplusia ni TaxID=7111 RepID=A0A7E5VNW2_TRINI|nr:cytochrome P450 4d8-like [Trichoplusia ni]